MPNSVDDPPRAPLPETIAGETSDTSPPNGANLEISGEADPSTPAAEGEPQRPRRRRRRHRPSPAFSPRSGEVGLAEPTAPGGEPAVIDDGSPGALPPTDQTRRRRRRRRGPPRPPGWTPVAANDNTQPEERISVSPDEPVAPGGNPAESGPGTGASAPAPATRREHSRRRHRRRRLLREAAATPEAESRSASGTVGDLASPDGASPAGGPRVGRPRDKRPRQADTQERGTRRDYSREQRGRSGEPRDGRERAPDHRRQGSRARGPRGARATDPHQARGRDAQQKKSEQKLYALEAVVDRGFDDVVEEAGEGVARRVHWTILKRTVADQKSGKPMSAVYVLQREGNSSEYPNLAAARAAVNKTIVHPEKLTMSKAEHAAAKK